MAPPKLLFLGALLAVLSFVATAQAPAPPPPPAPAATVNCNPLRLAVCANVLNGLLNVTLGLGALIPGLGGDGGQCCPLIRGLVNLDVAACLCAVVRANVLGLIRIDAAQDAIRLLLNRCGQTVPTNFTCPPPA
ncbi:hypothetical protein PR202_gb15800 [Eleusine coracana subsp. coracana]|uniref:Bifunctional inhibitor/plant lipid transfer protein/seed storage helical domain-containing protein n=1 Tax=Eleusine coracana subsp. coracana TaxID=191504 RepID=A0AAV5EY40_ELECO|nr:hypothetical protein QOZ80_4BG0350590 [Eleusine coracana subsp. coracana]GJN27752.1 hypothetical protein PR202_gb15800 [Eleusine coracana subsp. coracana]